MVSYSSVEILMIRVGFQNHLIWLKLNPKYFWQNYTYKYIRTNLSEMLKRRIFSLLMNLHEH